MTSLGRLFHMLTTLTVIENSYSRDLYDCGYDDNHSAFKL